jgi:hypothetical protein
MENFIVTFARLILGAFFLVTGLDGFLHVLPEPVYAPAAQVMVSAVESTGYMIPLLKIMELGAALLLLTNRFVPLAVTVMAPVILNIFLFHAFLAPGSMLILASALLVLDLLLIFSFRHYYQDALERRAIPDLTHNHITASMM